MKWFSISICYSTLLWALLRIVSTGGAILLFSLLSGCSVFSGTQSVKPVVIELEVSADDYINPDDSEQSNPVVVRLYQLTVADSFERAGFLDLYRQPETQLQGTLLGQAFLPVVTPGQRYLINIKLEPETRYLGVVAGFMQFDDAVNTALLEVNRSVSKPTCRLRITGRNISLQ